MAGETQTRAKEALTIEQTSRVLDGFHKETMNISDIREGSNVSGELLHKLGTSIPTPFARLHLFDSAFAEVIGDGTTHITDKDNNYFKLVSLALDMLEFLYLNGASSQMKVEKWDIDMQVNHLEQSGSAKHKKFSEAIRHAWDDGGYAGKALYMFKFGEEYIGGTSPLSLVFTNTNLKHTYPGLSNKHLLFDTDTSQSLLERDEEFRIYIYKLFHTYGHALDGTYLKSYINHALRNETPAVNQAINSFTALTTHTARMNELTRPTDGAQPLTPMEDARNPLTVALRGGSVTMLVKDLANVSFRTSYKIEAKRDHYKTYMLNGAQHEMKTPLALNTYGINAPYINSTYWKSGQLPISDKALRPYERKLPQTEINYPYLMASDFLEDHIIELGYKIQKGKFYTGLKEDTSFLVPLKKEFFKYFGPEHIQDMLHIEEDKDHLGRVTVVRVTLMIPLEGGQQIPFEMEYEDNKGGIVRAFEGTDSFNLGIFPFFVDRNKASKHHFKVMGVHTTGHFRLSFLDSARPDEEFQIKDEKDVGEYVVDERTYRNENESYNSKHYDIDKVFDIIEVEVTASGRTGTGLVLPAMRKIDSQNPGQSFTFGVDFGTTNTQIAYSSDGGTNIHTFSVHMNGGANDEVQMVYLNDHDVKDGKHLTEYGFGLFEIMKDASAREFLTPELKESDFPMRTAICEVDNLASVTPRMFGALNIGFNYSRELTEGIGRNRYKTELKWDYSDNRALNRIEVFFEELLWLMRNKSLLNNGGRDINVVVTYPQAMSGSVEDDFKDAWYRAADNIGLNRNFITFQLESIAPYYSFSRKQGLTDVYLNMDIGGGSTDILYHDPATGGEKLTFSVLFAANDIWGDGCSPLLVGGNNGYIRAYEQSSYYNSLSDEKKNKYLKVKQNSHKSSDIINYLFKNDGEYGFSRAVKRSGLALLPVVHFSALVFYIAHIVESFDLKSVCTLTFTGMGSTYLRMLGSEKQLERLANAIVDCANEYPKDKRSQLEIIFADQPKEVTAEGAVMIINATKADILKPARELCYGIEDEEGGETRISMGEVREHQQKGKVLAIYSRLADMLVDDESVRSILSNMGLDEAVNALPEAQVLKKIFADSFDAYQQVYTKKHRADADKTKVTESLFFWPLKDGLYQLGSKISK